MTSKEDGHPEKREGRRQEGTMLALQCRDIVMLPLLMEQWPLSESELWLMSKKLHIV